MEAGLCRCRWAPVTNGAVESISCDGVGGQESKGESLALGTPQTNEKAHPLHSPRGTRPGGHNG